jgi:hypothetical protein
VVVSVAERLGDWPLVVDVLPVYVRVVGALLSVNVLDPLEDKRTGVVVVLPPKEPESEYVPEGSFGVTEQVATPLAFVVPEHVWVPFTVSVTDWPGTGAFV